MSDDPSKSRCTAAPWTVLSLLILPTYFLSLGPAIWLHRNGWIPTECRHIYAPLYFVADKYHPIDALLEMYLDLWR